MATMPLGAVGQARTPWAEAYASVILRWSCASGSSMLNIQPMPYLSFTMP